MTLLRLLLIEDTPSDATLFIDQIQNSIGHEVEIDWVQRLGEAMVQLESGRKYDQIWLDPGLPDLREQSIGKALVTLKQFVPPGEVRMISSIAAPAVAQQAQQHDVAVVQKASLSRDGEILDIVREMLNRRSGGSTIKVANARLEVKVINLEEQVKINTERLNQIESQLRLVADRFTTIPFELESIKRILQEQKEAIAKQKDEKKEARASRTSVTVSIITAISAMVVAIVANVAPKLVDKVVAPVSPVSPPTRQTP